MCLAPIIRVKSPPPKPKGQETLTQGLPYWRQHKVLVLEFERLDWILSTKNEGILVFDKPLEILALNQLNGVG